MLVKKMVLSIIALLLIIGASLIGCKSQTTVKNIEKYPRAVGNYTSKLDECPSYLDYEKHVIDLRDKDLSGLDLTDHLEDLLHSMFDTGTKWPTLLPDGFDPVEILSLASNPGLGIKSLHDRGIDGSGVNIAMIDQTLLVDHIEYKNRVMVYEEIDSKEDTASMHGASMASIAVGEKIGAAPGAGLIYVCAYNWGEQDTLDLTDVTAAIRRIIDINEGLSLDDKIRVLSISLITSPEQIGYDAFMEAVEDAEKDGIFVISCNLFETAGRNFWYFGLDRNPLHDPESFESFYPVPWEDWLLYGCRDRQGVEEHYLRNLEVNMQSEFLLAPMMSRCYASFRGTEQYSFVRMGGWSTVEPWLAGIYAMCCQVMPEITPEIFWEKALETGVERTVEANGQEYTGKIMNPVLLIEALREN